MINIANISINNPFVLAPMSAINCTSYRYLCKIHGAGLIYTQMIDTERIICKKKEEIRNYINILDYERPVSVQLVGTNIKKLTSAARRIQDFADIIDINMGCIIPDYLNRGCGAALLKDTEKIEKILLSLKKTVKTPITAKIRIGWDSQTINAIKVCRLLEKAGASAIAIHGRTAEQKYGGKVNWNIIKDCKSAVSIPIIANGDVTSYEKGIEMLKKTGSDMVMIGREAKHAPWIFNKNFVKNNENVKEEILKFIRLYEKNEKKRSLNELKDHIYWMFRDIKTKTNPKKIHQLKTIKEIVELIKKA